MLFVVVVVVVVVVVAAAAAAAVGIYVFLLWLCDFSSSAPPFSAAMPRGGPKLKHIAFR